MPSLDRRDLQFICRRSLYLVTGSEGPSVRGVDDVWGRVGLDPRAEIGPDMDLVLMVSEVLGEVTDELLARVPEGATA